MPTGRGQGAPSLPWPRLLPGSCLRSVGHASRSPSSESGVHKPPQCFLQERAATSSREGSAQPVSAQPQRKPWTRPGLVRLRVTDGELPSEPEIRSELRPFGAVLSVSLPGKFRSKEGAVIKLEDEAAADRLVAEAPNLRLFKYQRGQVVVVREVPGSQNDSGARLLPPPRSLVPGAPAATDRPFASSLKDLGISLSDPGVRAARVSIPLALSPPSPTETCPCSTAAHGTAAAAAGAPKGLPGATGAPPCNGWRHDRRRPQILGGLGAGAAQATDSAGRDGPAAAAGGGPSGPLRPQARRSRARTAAAAAAGPLHRPLPGPARTRTSQGCRDCGAGAQAHDSGPSENWGPASAGPASGGGEHLVWLSIAAPLRPLIPPLALPRQAIWPISQPLGCSKARRPRKPRPRPPLHLPSSPQLA